MAVKTANKILEELGAWLMSVTFIFLTFKLFTFMAGNVYAEEDIQSGSYNAHIDSRLLLYDFKSDSAEMKPVLLK